MLLIITPIYSFVSAEEIGKVEIDTQTYIKREAKQKEIIALLESEIEKLKSIITNHGFGLANMPIVKENTQVATITENELEKEKEFQASIKPKVLHANCIRINKVLRREVYDVEVIKLQTFLKEEGHFSHPYITEYFGPVTEKALQDFQTAAGIVTQGTPQTTGFGQVGPLTIKRIETMTCQ